MSGQTPRQRAVTALGLAAAATLAALASVSCTAGGDDGDAARASGPPVVAPGKPGEDSKTLSPEQAKKARPGNRHNSADTAYVQNMITHHRQALRMTSLADRYATGKAVRRIADRISAAQKPEIDTMRAWLTRNGERQPSAGHHHEAMPGMATPEQLDALAAARKGAFDRLFLKLMITHHQGAVSMATDVLTQGNDVLVEEMATEVIAQQSSEIDRMRDM